MRSCFLRIGVASRACHGSRFVFRTLHRHQTRFHQRQKRRERRHRIARQREHQRLADLAAEKRHARLHAHFPEMHATELGDEAWKVVGLARGNAAAADHDISRSPRLRATLRAACPHRRARALPAAGRCRCPRAVRRACSDCCRGFARNRAARPAERVRRR